MAHPVAGEGVDAAEAVPDGWPLKMKLAVAALFSMALFSLPASATTPPNPFVQVAEISASDGVANDQFGASVAISGGTAVVGRSLGIYGATDGPGAAYVFVKPSGGWASTSSYAAKLVASDGLEGDLFGFAVAIDGDTIVVGAIGATTGINRRYGAAYVFVKPAGGWSGTLTETAKLTPSDLTSYAELGDSVGISGDTIVAGASWVKVGSHEEQGVAYVFVRPPGGWAGSLSQSARLFASDGKAKALLGTSVAISGDVVVAGAPTDLTAASGVPGVVYVFAKPGGGWHGDQTESAALMAASNGNGNQLGQAAAIEGDVIVAGAYEALTGPFSEPGAVYVFVKPDAGWSGTQNESARLTASDGQGGDALGYSVGVSGGTVVAGAYFAAAAPSDLNRGAAYVYNPPAGGWKGHLSQTAKVFAAGGKPYDYFGYAIATDGETILAGAPLAAAASHVAQGQVVAFAVPRPTRSGATSPILSPKLSRVNGR